MTRAALLLGALLVPVAATAQMMTSSPNSTATFGGTTSMGRSQSVATTGPIEVSGAEPESCSVSFSRSSAAINLSAVTSVEVGVGVACNTRFRLLAHATNGQLRLENGYAAGDPRTYVPYDVVWPVGLLDSTGARIAPGFTTSGIDWARGLSAQNGPTRLAQAGTVTVRWGGDLNVLAGNYGEVMYLDIQPN